MEDSMLCTTCFELVKSAKEHSVIEGHRSFTYPTDGELSATCLKCYATFDYFDELEVHIGDNKEHVKFKQMNAEGDIDVIFSVKKSKIASLEKISLFNDLKEEFSTPMKAPRRKGTSGSPAGGSGGGSGGGLEGMVEMLNARRNLEHLGLGKEVIEDIKKKYVLVEDHLREDTLSIIDDRLKKSVSKKKVDFELTNIHAPEKDKQYVFDPVLKQVCLKKVLHSCNTENQISVNKARRIRKVLGSIRNFVSLRRSISLREIYYIHPRLYSAQGHKQALSNDDVTDISTMLGLTTQSLNIFTSPTGTIKGPLLLYIGGKILADCRMGGIAGCRIPAEVHNVTKIKLKGKVDYILLVEKEGIFEELSADNFTEAMFRS